jgi:hypothetical protein
MNLGLGPRARDRPRSSSSDDSDRYAHRSPEYLEEAIYRTRTCLSSSSFTEFFSKIVFEPGSHSQAAFPLLRFHRRSRRTVWTVSISTSAETPESDQTLDEMESLLLVIRNDGDTTKIDEAIKKGRSIAASSHEALILNIFGDMLSMKHSTAQRRSSTLTSRLAYAVKYSSLRRFTGRAPPSDTSSPFPVFARPLPVFFPGLPHARPR